MKKLFEVLSTSIVRMNEIQARMNFFEFYNGTQESPFINLT